MVPLPPGASRVFLTVLSLAILALPAAGQGGEEPAAPAEGAGTAAAVTTPRLVMLLRHAEVEAADGRDPGLSDAGRARAAALVEAVAGARVGRIVTSELRRARETARPIAEALGLEPVAVPVTREGGLAGHVSAVVEAVLAADAGADVVVVGHANTVPAILRALGGPRLPDLAEDDHATLLVLLVGVEGAPRLVRARLEAGPPPPPPPPPWDPSDPCPGVAFPDQATSPYVLPYPVGARFNVRQGNCNAANSHHDGFNETFAYDFEMPIGSTVVAARGGRVFAVIERFTDEDHQLDEGNVVAIDHGDGTYAKYGHLTHDGALVAVGDLVKPGQPIGLSGDSGLSRGPHLHFSVKRCPGQDAVGSPTCRTIPISFRNTRAHPRGLVGSATSAPKGGEWYEAYPYEGAPPAGSP